MHRLSKTTKISTNRRLYLLSCDSTPHNATVRQVFPACPGKPFASAPFGDAPFHHTTAVRKPNSMVTHDTTRLYQFIKSLPQDTLSVNYDFQ